MIDEQTTSIKLYQKIEKTDLAYIAGLIDGEGCITIGKGYDKRRARNATHCLQFAVRMTDNKALLFLKEKFPEGNIRIQHNKPPQKDCYHYQATNAKAISIIKAVLPYLRTKKEQANLALAFYQYPPQQHPITKREFDRREAIYNEIHKLNKRGC